MLWFLLLLSMVVTAGLVIENGWMVAFYDLWIPIVLVVGLFSLFCIIMALLFCIGSLFINKNKPVDKRKWIYDSVVDISAHLVLLYGRVSVHVSGKEKIPKDTRFLFVSNHRSRFDPLVCAAKLASYKLSFVSKSSNFKIPFVEKYMHKCCYISLDRDDMRDAVKMVNQAVTLIGSNEASVAIYPEGTRNVTDSLLEFRNGAFKIALKAKVPVVVTTVRNTELVVKNFPFHRTHIYIDIVGVLSYEAIKDMTTKEIGDLVKSMMEENLKKPKSK